MSKSPLQKFINLIEFDRSVGQAKKEIHKIEEEINSFKVEEALLQQKIERTKKMVHEARKQVDEKELEMKELDQQEKAKKTRLDQVKNQKEYQSIKFEIDAISKQQIEVEVDLLGVWSKLEKTQKEVEQASQEIEPKIKEIKEKIIQFEQKKKEAHQEVDRLVQESKKQQEGVPEEWLEKYEAMKGRVHDPAVPIVNGTCSACFYSLLSEDALLLGRKALLQCKSCFRFIYKPEEKQKEQNENAPEKQAVNDANKSKQEISE